MDRDLAPGKGQPQVSIAALERSEGGGVKGGVEEGGVDREGLGGLALLGGEGDLGVDLLAAW